MDTIIERKMMMNKIRAAIVISIAVLLSSCATNGKDDFTIGIAWRDDTKSEAFQRVYDYLSTEADVVILPKTTTSDLEYYDGNISDEYLNLDFSLSNECAEIVRNTNNIAAPGLSNVDLIVFTGGEDISPSLYKSEYELSDIAKYNPERDVSDYLLMKYAYSHGIPIFGICRGLQMMGVVSGATLVDDIPTLLSSLGSDNEYIHRTEDGKYAFHSIDVLPGNTIKSLEKLSLVASSHHQSVDYSTISTMRILAIENNRGAMIVESAMLPSKSLALGIQFHPEYYTKGSRCYKESIALLKEIRQLSL